MAVLMVAGNVVQMPNSIFQSVRVLTANIALEMAYAKDTHRAGLFASGLFLTILVLFLAVIAARITGRQRHG
jgi:phosphate transport system permease protein